MSPDLNIQENVWKMISNIAYDQTQYFSAETLWESVQETVKCINTQKREIVKEIYNKFNSRLLQVIENKGNEIPY